MVTSGLLLVVVLGEEAALVGGDVSLAGLKSLVAAVDANCAREVALVDYVSTLYFVRGSGHRPWRCDGPLAGSRSWGAMSSR